MAEPWFHVPGLAAGAEQITLDADEARHAVGARRISGGEVVRLFDGRGEVALARLHMNGHEVTAEILERQQAPMRVPAAHLASALPKGDRAWTLISMAAQLGMASFTPLICARGVVEPGKSFAQRAERIAIEACKQTRQAHVPVIHEPAGIQQIADRWRSADGTVWIAHPGGERIKHAAERGKHAAIVLIGPEGGFTDEEVASALDGGAVAIDLGENLLRIETAAIAVMSYLRLIA